MFVRRKLNKSGSISVQLIDKGRGQYKVVRTFGVAHTDYEADLLENKARQYLKEMTGSRFSLFEEPGKGLAEEALSSVLNGRLQIAGPELIFGELYDRMGFGSIPDKLFRHMVISRICEGGSYLKAVGYLKKSLGTEVPAGDVYRSLDEICFAPKAAGGNIQTAVGRIASEHAGGDANNGDAIFILTGLRFEAPAADELAAAGFSKEKKIKCPKVILGLLMSPSGTPVSYDIYKSEAFKGGKLLSIVKKMAGRHGYSRPVVVSDAPLLTRATIKLLDKASCRYILIKKAGAEEDGYHALAARVREAFAMSRFDLQIKPLLHRRLNRIKGHACICFAALAILAELERLMKTSGTGLTLDNAVEAVKTIYRMNYISPATGRPVSDLLQMDATQRAVYDFVYIFSRGES